MHVHACLCWVNCCNGSTLQPKAISFGQLYAKFVYLYIIIYPTCTKYLQVTHVTFEVSNYIQYSLNTNDRCSHVQTCEQ